MDGQRSWRFRNTGALNFLPIPLWEARPGHRACTESRIVTIAPKFHGRRTDQGTHCHVPNGSGCWHWRHRPVPGAARVVQRTTHTLTHTHTHTHTHTLSHTLTHTHTLSHTLTHTHTHTQTHSHTHSHTHTRAACACESVWRLPAWVGRFLSAACVCVLSCVFVSGRQSICVCACVFFLFSVHLPIGAALAATRHHRGLRWARCPAGPGQYKVRFRTEHTKSRSSEKLRT